MEELFSIGKFNVYSDDNNYYFFRALEELDISGIANKTITNQYGRINKLITDREFYGQTKYSPDSNISLGEVADHIKVHYNKHTNCISFSSNANVGLLYGRGTYQDSYIVLRIPKEELGKTTYFAGSYMLEEITKEIDRIIDSGKIDSNRIDLINKVKQINSQEELTKFIEENLVTDDNSGVFQGGIDFVDEVSSTKSIKFKALDDEQNFYKNKVVTMIDLLGDKNIVPHIANNYLIRTLGLAFSSLEVIHYNDIDDEHLAQVSKEFMDVLALVQQLPNDINNLKELRQELIDYINGEQIELDAFRYDRYKLSDSDYTIEKMYQLTNGDIDYANAIRTYRNMFYLAKSRLRAIKVSNWLRKITNNDYKYRDIYKYIEEHGYGIEEEITSKLSRSKFDVSESVGLTLNVNEEELLEIINGYSELLLDDIVNSPLSALKTHLRSLSYIEDNNVDKLTYFANAIVDSFDWKNKLNINRIYDDQRREIVDKLKEIDCLDFYYRLKDLNFNEKDIVNVLLTSAIKNKDIHEIDVKDTFTIEELEDFLGYYKVENTKKLTLRNYQVSALKNIDKLFKTHNFAAAVLPTGAGKSFVALSEMMEHKDEKILYLAPNNEILNQIKRYVKVHVHGKEHTTGKSADEILKEVFPNIVLTTYQNLREENAKDIINGKYGLIILDELHRTGASEWSTYVKELIENQNEKAKVLGISATPQRDMDLKDMSEIWAERLGYSEDAIVEKKHLAVNMDIIEGIKSGYIIQPRVITCEYSIKNDDAFISIKDKIESISDVAERNEKLEKYEKLRRNILQSSGIEKILNDNLKSNGRYIVFLPITKKSDDKNVFEDEDGNQISNSKAESIIQAYQNQMRQYIFAGEYLEKNKDIFVEIEKCINENKELNSNIIDFINKEKENILLLSKIESVTNNNLLVSKCNDLAEAIITKMEWEHLSERKQGKILNEKTKDRVENYSMLGNYGDKKNEKELANFSSSNSNKVKFMFVMNKLNEGVHVDKIDGIIWFRPMDENSKILYLQQLGRCIYGIDPNKEIKEEDRPVVFDFVNNSLKVDLIKDEILEAKDLNLIRLITNYVDERGSVTLDRDSSNALERHYAKELERINITYYKYIENPNLIEELDFRRKHAVKNIIDEGSKVDLWDVKLEKEHIEKSNDKTGNYDLLDIFEIKGVARDFLDLYGGLGNISTYEIMYNYLVKLKEQGESVDLSANDKIRIEEDGTLTIVKRKLKKVNGKSIIANLEEYNDKSLIKLGDWLYRNVKINEDLSGEWKQKFEEIGYLNLDEIDIYTKLYNYLLKLKEQGESVDLKQNDKIRVEEDGTLTIIKKKIKKVKGKSIVTNPEEYNDENLVRLGGLLDVHVRRNEKLDSEWKQKFEEIGYLNLDEIDIYTKLYNYLLKLKEQGESVDLKRNDKIRIEDDGTLTIIKKKCNRVKGELFLANPEEYNDENLVRLGGLLDAHVRKNKKLDSEWKQKFEEIGYLNLDEIDIYTKLYNYLLKLKEQGESVDLSANDKIRIEDDGTLTIIKKKIKKVKGKSIVINPEEYNDENLVRLGGLLDAHVRKNKKLDSEWKQKFEEMGYLNLDEIDIYTKLYNYLVKLKEQGESLNLSIYDKIRIEDDGNLIIVKKKQKIVDGKLVLANPEEYNDENLVRLGGLLDAHVRKNKKLDSEWKQKFEEIGYLNLDEIDIYTKLYNYLLKLKEQGDSVCLSNKDKIRIEDDGSLSIIKPIFISVEGKQILANPEEYKDKSLISLGDRLYKNIKRNKKLSEEWKKKFEDIGYLDKEESKSSDELDWNIGISEVEKYYGIYGDLYVISGYKCPGSSFPLREFLDIHRDLYNAEDKSELQLQHEKELFDICPNWLDKKKNDSKDEIKKMIDDEKKTDDDGNKVKKK